MPQIEVKFDHTLEQSEIIVPLIHSSEEEAGQSYEDNKAEIQQTLVYGIRMPLISVNNIVIDFDNIVDFSLKSKEVFPSISMTVRDKYGLIDSIDTPGMDNEIRIQILPQFEGIYKKIDLTFYISKCTSRNNFLTITGLYKIPEFTMTKLKAFGEVNTYNLYEEIAKESKLGFASNVQSNDQDKRYVYCDYKSYEELLEKEINFAGSKTNIMDYWVDFWNNLTLVDIYERYNTIDKDEDMMIWVSVNPDEIGEGNNAEPVQLVATISNNPAYKETELYVKDYQIITNSGTQLFNGTDRLYSIYEANLWEHMDYLVQDGDVKKDIYTKFEYLGEIYGNYNYMLQNILRRTLLQKIKSEYLQVTLYAPSLGILRGDKINFVSYVNDSMIENKFKDLSDKGLINPNPETNIPLNDFELPEEEVKADGGQLSIDRAISGQYLIIGCDIKYSDNQWSYELLLSRPADQKPKFILENE